jgi:hypothetical protein
LRLNGREIWRWSVAMLVLLGLEFRKGWGLFHLDLREPRPLRILMMPFGLKGMERRGWLHSGLVVLGVGRRERRGTLGLGCRRGLLHLGWIGVMPLRVLLRQLRTGRGWMHFRLTLIRALLLALLRRKGTRRGWLHFRFITVACLHFGLTVKIPFLCALLRLKRTGWGWSHFRLTMIVLLLLVLLRLKGRGWGRPHFGLTAIMSEVVALLGLKRRGWGFLHCRLMVNRLLLLALLEKKDQTLWQFDGSHAVQDCCPLVQAERWNQTKLAAAVG